MYLESILKTKQGQKLNKYHQDQTTYPYLYKYWSEKLFERLMRLFIWENTGDVPPKEIETRRLLDGKVAITKIPDNLPQKKYKKGLTAMFCSFFGVTEYQDEWHNVTVRCPIWAGQKTIGKDVVVIDNNSLRNSALPLINHYASLLAHADVTLINIMVEARDTGGVPVVPTEKAKQEMAEYLSKRYNGQFSSMVSSGMLGIEFMGINRGTQQSIKDMQEVKTSIMKAFWGDIGIRTSFEKKNNAVEAEITSDTSLLQYNLLDSLEKAKEGCEAVNALFGTNWSVHIAKEINYELDEHQSDETPDVQQENTEPEVEEE